MPTDEPLDHPAEEWTGLLQAQGYRISAPLRTIVEILATSRRLLNPLQLFDLVRGKNSRFSLVTVYRSVENSKKWG